MATLREGDSFLFDSLDPHSFRNPAEQTARVLWIIAPFVWSGIYECRIAAATGGCQQEFGGTTVLKPLRLDLAQGEMVALLGPSGCGKTTTLRLIAGFEAPDTGSIVINGRDMTSVPPYKRGLGMVFQNYSLFHI